MRIFVLALLPLMVAVVACGGDSSALMSNLGFDGAVTLPTGGQGGASAGQGGAGGSNPASGQGGQTVVSSGGSGGAGGAASSGTITVPGGTRDVATTVCATATGSNCAVAADKIACAKTYCSANLVDCYNSDGTAASGGRCKTYAVCRLACSCDVKDQLKCENKCMADYGTPNPDCSDCIFSLYLCSAQYGCTPPTTCTATTSGS